MFISVKKFDMCGKNANYFISYFEIFFCDYFGSKSRFLRILSFSPVIRVSIVKHYYENSMRNNITSGY